MEDTPDFDDLPSKSQRKRDMDALQDIGAELTELNEQQLASIELPENLRDAVLAARVMKRNEARRRQVQYIGKLMRQVDPAPIRVKLDGFCRSRPNTPRSCTTSSAGAIDCWPSRRRCRSSSPPFRKPTASSCAR